MIYVKLANRSIGMILIDEFIKWNIHFLFADYCKYAIDK